MSQIMFAYAVFIIELSKIYDTVAPNPLPTGEGREGVKLSPILETSIGLFFPCPIIPQQAKGLALVARGLR